MIPALVVGVLTGAIVGWAISAWRHARIDNAPTPPSVGISCIGLTDGGKGGVWLDPYFARLLAPILKDLDREVM